MMNKRISLFILIILTLSLFGSSPKSVNAVTWWNNDWSYKMKLTINATKVNADLTDFPVLVYLNSSRIDWNHVQDDLDDLTFTDSTETVTLMAELENYTVNSEAWIWVKIPMIDDTVDTDFYLYYGNNICSSYWNPEDVWEDSAVMVQHMTDNPDNAHIIDSTQYDNDGTKKGVNEPIETASGKIDSAQNFDGNDYLYILHNASLSLTSLSIELWIKPVSVGLTYSDIIFKGVNEPRNYHIRRYGTYLDFDYTDTVNIRHIWRSNSALPTAGLWYHVVFTFAASSILLKVNGQTITGSWITGTGNGTPQTNTNNVYFAYPISDWYNGAIDEARIYNEIKSAEWIKADYNSGADTLLIYGAEELCPLALTILYNTGINKLYINGTERANNTTIYVDKNVNVNATVTLKPNFIFMKYALSSTGASLIPIYIFNMTNPFTLWSYATPNFFIYEEPTTFTFTHWLILLFMALVISLLAAIKFHIIATVSLILVLYMVINVASYTGIILLAIIVWLLTIMFSIIAFGEI